MYIFIFSVNCMSRGLWLGSKPTKGGHIFLFILFLFVSLSSLLTIVFSRLNMESYCICESCCFTWNSQWTVGSGGICSRPETFVLDKIIHFEMNFLLCITSVYNCRKFGSNRFFSSKKSKCLRSHTCFVVFLGLGMRQLFSETVYHFPRVEE